MTNFEKITRSPEILTNFLEQVIKACYFDDCKDCPIGCFSSAYCNKHSIRDYLEAEAIREVK